ncbi:MAG: putative ABC transporter permease [Methanocorpusculum sp.]|uniref:putative ABC transporter permease n=1 Tax=Methanocorpusculum sp. TaxID=2058474 RepID=UPI0027262C0D|nr:putative ABC transporter permease [Methanocorpusculum sp.]MDO9522156.1 putative ABC transporter permease [Methanocorpusculum sp.]
MMLAAYFLGFIFYSFLGWIWETTYCSIKAKHFINRGFLNGPIIPIYGCGAVLIMLAVNAFGTLALPTPTIAFNIINILVVFFGGMLLATILEYIVAVILESFFHIKLWDYSKNKFNFQGRICLKCSLFFGLLSVLFIMVIEPLTTHTTTQIPDMVINIAAGIVGVILAIDIAISLSALLKLNERLRAAEEIINARVGITLVEAAKIRDTLHEKIEERVDENQVISKFHYQIQRMARAYPGSTSLRHSEIWEKLKKQSEKQAK